jgi:hypothetical protein
MSLHLTQYAAENSANICQVNPKSQLKMNSATGFLGERLLDDTIIGPQANNNRSA